MREKELRLASICYGGISLAIYMHGVTKEIWRLARASRAFLAGSPPVDAHEAAWIALFQQIETEEQLRVRVLPDIVAGASAGGINGIFLAQAIATGQSLEPLTALWLDNADVDTLLDPDAQPLSRFTKFWAMPIVWWLSGRRGGTIQQTVSKEARDEVRAKLSRLVRARWFAPPFGGREFSAMLLDAFDAMAAGTPGPRLLPIGQPLDLFVTVTDFGGHPQTLGLNSPTHIVETEHRLTIGFSQGGTPGDGFAHPIELAFAARATASFPGAFPPFNIAEIDGIVAASKRPWPSREAFLARIFPGRAAQGEHSVLIDGSVLANAPFRPAIEALRDRPARREVDRRFIYIDPKPGMKAVKLTRRGEAVLPGFIATIFGAMSDIPREQPIRDSLEALEARSARIRRLQRIVESIQPDVEAAIESLFGRTFFLDRPTAARVSNWRRRAQDRAARDAGYGYGAYAHAKLSGIVEDIAGLAQRIDPAVEGERYEAFRQALWAEVRRRGADAVFAGAGKGASDAAIDFFRNFDLGFRVRRLRFVLRTVARLQDQGLVSETEIGPLRTTLFRLLSHYLERERAAFYTNVVIVDAPAFLSSIATLRNLTALDAETDTALAEVFAACPKTERRTILFAYLGFPFFDLATLPMLQGEGLDEFDPIKVDRISPEDATMVRSGVIETLKGIEFNSFGAFFSRAYRENDYLWGRLHGADRLFDIVLSTSNLAPGTVSAIKRRLLLSILDDEQKRLTRIAPLFGEVRAEIAPSSGAA